MTLFLRFFVIAFGFLCACFTAALVVTFGLLKPEIGNITSAGPEAIFILLAFGAAAGLITPFYVFAPSFVVILVAEALSIRTVLYYALAGAVIGALAYVLSDVTAHTRGTGTVAPLTWELQLMAAAGIVAGFVYWLIAGRRAGAWKGV